MGRLGGPSLRDHEILIKLRVPCHHGPLHGRHIMRVMLYSSSKLTEVVVWFCHCHVLHFWHWT